MADRARIVIVEDHALTRAGLRTALAHDFVIAGEAADGVSGWNVIVQERPDVAVIDLGLPGMDGVALTQRVRGGLPDTRVVIVTMMDSESQVLAALAAGADAYCVKTSEPEQIAAAVRIASEGGAYFDPRIAHIVLSKVTGNDTGTPASSPLTPRETEVLRLAAGGAGNTEIAERLHIGLGTVKNHIRDILEKMAASDRTQAAVEALRRGYI
jgi:DNA-binding NarL/FixJ family response regulator